MIPRDFITEWRSRAPWADNAQVEQDLVICRALVNIFSQSVLRDALAFRGGTALYKLYLTPAARYSEDIDLVQVRPEPAGAVMDALRAVLKPWLGEAKWKQTEGRVTFNYRFASEDPSPIPLRLKVEVNTREHFTEHGFQSMPFEVASRWFSGACGITTYSLDELLGTKLRALYQRRKGRDLFDIATAISRGGVDPTRIMAYGAPCEARYCALSHRPRDCPRTAAPTFTSSTRSIRAMPTTRCRSKATASLRL